MVDLPELPEGSAVRIERGHDHVWLWWRQQLGRCALPEAVLLLICGLMCWIAAVLLAILSWPSVVLALFSLPSAGLGVLALNFSHKKLSPPPEVLVLETDGLTHGAGMRPPSRESKYLMPWGVAAFFNAWQPITVRRDQVEEVRLSTDRRRKRLVLEPELDELEDEPEIGRSLRDADREWLYEILRRWKG